MSSPTSDPLGPDTALPIDGGAATRPPARWSLDATSLVAFIAVAGAVIWSYAPNFANLVHVWWTEPDYTHGFLVLPICAYILRSRWPGRDDEIDPAPWWGGWVVVVAALGAREFFHDRGSSWTETATSLPAIAGLALARFGWPTFRRTWPAFAFLVFCLPLPPAVNATLSQPLQGLATTGSVRLLRLTGLWVMPEGNVILIGNEKLEVAAACNGLSMLMSLAATVAATASIVPMSSLKRVVLLASIIPIALMSNILRIAATAWCYYRFGAQVGSEYAHDLAGWLMMPMAMLLVFLELSIMSWLIIEATDTSRSFGLLTMDGGPKALKAEGRS